MSARLLIAGAVVWAAGCEGVMPEFDWQQMIDQHKLQPYERSTLFPDGRAMQSPPEGTVARDRIVGRPALTDGMENGAYVDRIPVPLARELFATGRFGYDTYCAACHGLDGSGESAVSTNMELRKPPSLLTQPVLGFPVGRLFQVASDGYGLMPSYSLELSVRERWAVVAYVRALQLRRAVELRTLPPPLRKEAEGALAMPVHP